MVFGHLALHGALIALRLVREEEERKRYDMQAWDIQLHVAYRLYCMYVGYCKAFYIIVLSEQGQDVVCEGTI